MKYHVWRRSNPKRILFLPANEFGRMIKKEFHTFCKALEMARVKFD